MPLKFVELNCEWQLTGNSFNCLVDTKTSFRGVTALDLFEYSLKNRQFGIASRFLTSACEYLGASDSFESIVCSLTMALELLHESLTCLYLSQIIQVAEFCIRLETMAREIPSVLPDSAWDKAKLQTVLKEQRKSSVASSSTGQLI